jgi:hypothetical protein
LWFSAFALLLLQRLRTLALEGTELAKATAGTIRQRLLKIGALVTVSTRRVYVRLASAFPLQKAYSFGVSEIAGGCHSANSLHYRGLAVDVNVINGKHVSSTNPYLCSSSSCAPASELQSFFIPVTIQSIMTTSISDLTRNSAKPTHVPYAFYSESSIAGDSRQAMLGLTVTAPDYTTI